MNGIRLSLVRLVACGFVALPACNAILGAGDYHVGSGTDGGSDQTGSGGSDDDGGNTTSTGGKPSTSGGSTASGGSGDKGTGGRASAGTTGSSGGATSTGGATGTGGKTGALTAEDFVGQWTCPDETIVTDCGDGNPTTDTSSDIIEWTLSGGALETTFTSCTLKATVSGRTATISPPVTCDDNGITYVISGSFSIGSDGKGSLVEVVMVGSSGASCTLTGRGTYTKS